MSSFSFQSAAVSLNRTRPGALAWLAMATAISAFGLTAQASTISYRSVEIDNVKIAYRETGSAGMPTMLLLHGVPSSSRMYDGLMRKLGDRYHMVALDYPGFGNSDAPAPDRYTYTFDHLAQTSLKLATALGLNEYVLFMQDYGAPVGMRMAVAEPCRVQGTIFQNGNVYADGLGPMWAQRRPFWENRAAHEQEVRAAHLSVAVTRGRHVGADPDVEAYDPDLWMDEYAYLNRPGQAEIQSELIFDYRKNLESYPDWQTWLRTHQPPTLVVWGKYDPAFTVRGAEAFRRDLPQARIVILDAGHFAMDTRLEEVAAATDAFMQQNAVAFGRGRRPDACAVPRTAP